MNNSGLAIVSIDETERIASAMVKSGYFSDVKDVAQATVKILAGREMGFGAFASLTGVYIIQGRPSIGANLMAAAVKSSRRYNYKVAEMTETACEIIFTEAGQECGRSRFTIEDARKAGTKNLDKFARNMLFARAMSNGCRWYCPDVFNGAPTYTPEEMGANVNEAGDVIDIPSFEPVKTPATVTKVSAPPAVTVTPPALDFIEVPEVSVEEAFKVWTSDKTPVLYSTIESEKLSHMAAAIGSKLLKHGYSDDAVKTAEFKLGAIRAILAFREQAK